MENTEELNEFWTDEFAPHSLDDMVLTDELRKKFDEQLKSRTKFNILLVGTAGIGKTTIAEIIARELNASVLFIPCGVEGTVSTAQGKIKNFCDSLSMEGKQKIVILDELDSSSGTQDNSMQKVLRNIITESKDTMFIGTCNYVEKVIEPLRSRLGVVNLKFTAKDLLKRLMYILNTKKIKYTKTQLQNFIDNVLKIHYPDIRQIISILQSSCASGELIVNENTSSNDKSFLKDLVEKCRTEKDVLNLRQYYMTNKSKIEDYMTFSSDIFNYILDNGLIKDGDMILKLSNIIYQMNIVIDKEIQFFSMIVQISKGLKQ